MTKLMQLSTALSATVDTTRDFDGLVACFGATKKSDHSLSGVSRRMRRSERRRRQLH